MGKQELLDRARDELFSHIHRCGVLQATESDQDSWMSETIEYLAERYPDLGVAELTQLKAVGLRFCKPVISRLKKEETPAEQAAEAEETPAAEGETGETPVTVAEGVEAVEAEAAKAADAEAGDAPVTDPAAVGAA